jgi:hypothetical protein
MNKKVQLVHDPVKRKVAQQTNGTISNVEQLGYCAKSQSELQYKKDAVEGE